MFLLASSNILFEFTLRVLMSILDKLTTPCWLFDPEIIATNYLKFKEIFDYATVAYAFKANPHLTFAKRLVDAGAYFCVVSTMHLKTLLEIGVKPYQIFYSHPIKSMDAIQFALQSGVSCFACDSLAEIDKIAYFKTPVEIYIRIEVPSTGSMIPLSGKFGVTPEYGLELMHYAAQHGLKPIGFTFHTGSQCLRLSTWDEAIQTVAAVWESARQAFDVDFINIGGGFAVPYASTPEFDLGEIAARIRYCIADYLPCVKRIVLEPGRAVAAPAGAMLTSVIGIAKRPDGNNWLYIDAGVYCGLFETIDNIRYQVKVVPLPEDSLESKFLHTIQHQNFSKTDADGLHTYLIGGQTCDSTDKLFAFTTPNPVLVGDRLLFQNIGAYSYGMETSFNGFRIPNILITSIKNLI